MSRIVTDILSCENQIHQFFLNQKIGNLLKRSNIDKEKGISPVTVFRVLVTLAFTGKNLFRTLEAGGSCGMAKDTVYRFLNSVHTNWRRFLLLLSSRVINQELDPLTGAANIKVLIADDTLYRRNRSKHVELLSRVFDHTDNRYYRGFRMLTLGWSEYPLTSNNSPPILQPIESNILVRQARLGESSWLRSQPDKVSRPSEPSFAFIRVIV